MLNVAAGLFPRAVPRMIRMTLNALTDDEYINKSYRVFNIGRANHVPAYSAEIGVPVDERGLPPGGDRPDLRDRGASRAARRRLPDLAARAALRRALARADGDDARRAAR